VPATGVANSIAMSLAHGGEECALEFSDLT